MNSAMNGEKKANVYTRKIFKDCNFSLSILFNFFSKIFFIFKETLKFKFLLSLK